MDGTLSRAMMDYYLEKKKGSAPEFERNLEIMATSSKSNDEFFEACSGSEIKVSRIVFGEV